MIDKNVQAKIFEEVEKKIKGKEKLHQIISRILQIGPNAAYKRIKGTTTLNFREVIILSQHFEISLDALILNYEHNIIFKFSNISNQINTYSEYLQPLLGLAEMTNHFPSDSFEVYYATNELPIFHYFDFKYLNYFKYYIWKRSNWDVELEDKLSFKNHIQPNDQFLDITDKISKGYYNVRSVEYLSANAIYNTLQQINYIHSINKYESSEEAFLVYQDLRDLLKHLSKMAKTGKKFRPGDEPNEDGPSYSLFYNQIIQSNNISLIKTPLGNHTFTTFDNPNVLHSEDDRIMKYTLDWFEKLKISSYELSNSSEKNRIQFFDNLYKKIDAAEEELRLKINK